MVNVIADMCGDFQVHPSQAETDSTTSRIADTSRVVSYLERDIYHITLNEQMQFKKELPICLIELEGSWLAPGFQELQKSIEQGCDGKINSSSPPPLSLPQV